MPYAGLLLDRALGVLQLEPERWRAVHSIAIVLGLEAKARNALGTALRRALDLQLVERRGTMGHMQYRLVPNFEQQLDAAVARQRAKQRANVMHAHAVSAARRRAAS